MQEYKLGKKSVDDYVSRFNEILERGIYKGKSQITPNMEATIEKELL